MFSYMFLEKQGLKEGQKKESRGKCKGLVARAGREEHLLTLFSDEKLFLVDRVQTVNIPECLRAAL